MRAVPYAGENVLPFSPIGFVRYALEGGHYHPLPGSGDEGVVAVFMCYIFLRYFRLGRSDDIFVDDSGEVHNVLCLTRGDVVFYADGTRLQYVR